MMKNNKMLLIGVVAVLIAYFGFIQPGLTRRGGASVAQSSGANMMTAEINGNKVALDLVKAKISNNKIYVTYFGYNPRGEAEVEVDMVIRKSIEPGTYAMEDMDDMLELAVTINRQTLHAKYNWTRDYAAANGSDGFSMSSVNQPGKLGDQFIGNYTLKLTGRSDDWRTYEGRLDATVVSYMSDDMATIRNASFNFTL